MEMVGGGQVEGGGELLFDAFTVRAESDEVIENRPQPSPVA